MCESIGHRPLWSRCPAPSLNFKHNLLRLGMGTADHLTLLRLFNLSCIFQKDLVTKPALLLEMACFGKITNKMSGLLEIDKLSDLKWVLKDKSSLPPYILGPILPCSDFE